MAPYMDTGGTVARPEASVRRHLWLCICVTSLLRSLSWVHLGGRPAADHLARLQQHAINSPMEPE